MQDVSHSSPGFVREILEDREKGAARLVAERHGMLYAAAYSLCGDAAMAEDLVFRTFERVLERIASCRDETAFDAWMKAILRNEWLLSIRSPVARATMPAGTPSELEHLAEATDGASAIRAAADHDIVRSALDSLPHEEREVLLLHYFADLTVAQIAKFVSIPAGTVMSRLFYARRALAAKLGAAAKKPGAKALLIALALCGLTALGAATSLAVVRLLSPHRAAQEQQAYDSKGAAAPSLATGGSTPIAVQDRTGGTGGTEGTGEAGAADAASVPSVALVPPVQSSFETDSFTTQTPQQEQTMNTKTLLAASAAFAVAASTADTLTWTGGSSGLLSVSSNWTPSASPQPGDTCVFHSAVTLEAEDFDFGAGGLTLENDATLTVLTHFAGTGGITKRGNGTLAIKNTTAGTFTGDVTIEAGQLNLASGSAIQFGQGKIIFTQISASNYFITQGDFYSQNLKNEIEFRGESSTQAIYLCRNATISGSISSLYDFRIGIDYLGFTVSGGINAPGRTVTIEFPQSWNSCECNLSGSINASLVKKHSKDTTLSGSSDYIDNSLRVEGGNLIVASAGYWGGTNVLVSGSSSVLRLRGSQNLSTLASVQVENGGKLNLDSACAVTVSSLIVDGAAQRSGMYGASNLPNYITGAGSIIVSPKTWVGGASGYLSAASNWSDGVAPQPGDVLSFSNPVELLNETVNLGAEGYTLSSSHAISNHVWFTGSGGIVKRGSGSFYQFGDAGGDFAGGARFENCQLILLNRYQPGTSTTGHKFFGTGMVALDGNDARIRTGEWACGLTNAIDVTNSFIPSWDSGWGSLTVDQGSVVIGPIVSSSNLKLHVRNIEMHLPSIDAPGHTVQIDTYWGSSSESYRSGPVLDGPVNANVATAGNRTIIFNGSSPNPDHSLTLTTCTNVLSSTAYWGGSNIVVSGTNTRLVLTNAGNLSEEAQISVLNSGKIDIASGVKVKVGSLTVDGVEMPSGIYGAANLPSAITGGGKLKIGEGATVLYVR